MGCWFVLLRAEPVALHSCPMHGGLHGHGGASAAAAAEQLTPHHHRHDASPTPAQPAPTDSTEGCLCLGACCAAGLAALPAAPATAAIAIDLISGESVRAPLTDDAPRSRGARLLPFATAPPIAS